MPAIYQPVITNNHIKGSHFCKITTQRVYGRRGFLHIFEHIKKYLDRTMWWLLIVGSLLS